uniref:Inner centromere protein A n=1 Tax=Strongyloides venezuelensis TaxID=75913 RepID=A0A0K0FZL9_STRVS
MTSRIRQRGLRKTLNKKEKASMVLTELASEGYISKPSSIDFSSSVPEYETIKNIVKEVASVYSANIHYFCEATRNTLKEQRARLKNNTSQENNEIKIPKSSKGDKNVSKVDKTHGTLGIRKGRMTKKNLFSDSKPSSNGNATSGSEKVATLRPRVNNQASSTIRSRRSSKNVASASCRVQNFKKRNRDTCERATLLAQQGSDLRRADNKKKNLLKEKAERAKREREEKARQVEERRRLKEKERKGMFKDIKQKEEHVKEFRNRVENPGSSNSQRYGTPISSVSPPKISNEDTINGTFTLTITKIGTSRTRNRTIVDKSYGESELVYETPKLPMGEIKAITRNDRTIVDKSLEDSDLIYETPAVSRKRRRISPLEDETLFSPPSKNGRVSDCENVTPNVTFNCYKANTLNSDISLT